MGIRQCSFNRELFGMRYFQKSTKTFVEIEQPWNQNLGCPENIVLEASSDTNYAKKGRLQTS